MRRFIKHFFVIHNNKIVYNHFDKKTAIIKYLEYSKKEPDKYNFQELHIPFDKIRISKFFNIRKKISKEE